MRSVSRLIPEGIEVVIAEQDIQGEEVAQTVKESVPIISKFCNDPCSCLLR